MGGRSSTKSSPVGPDAPKKPIPCRTRPAASAPFRAYSGNYKVNDARNYVGGRSTSCVDFTSRAVEQQSVVKSLTARSIGPQLLSQDRRDD